MSGNSDATPAILRTLTLGDEEWQTRGVLRPSTMPPGAPARYPPAPDVSAFVDLFWIARWDLAPGEQRVVETLPHPCVNVVIEPRQSLVHGPVRGRFSKTLVGSGMVVSARLRPGAFRGVMPRPAWRLVNTAVGLEEAFGVASRDVELAVFNEAEDGDRVRALESFLRAHLPPPDPAVDLIDRVIASIAGDRELVRVEDLALAVGLGRRTIERLFRDYVGLSPKWVIRKYRLQAAADEAAKDRPVNWALLASELGYADQAHLIRDFRAMLGTTPSAFSRGRERTGGS